MGDSIRPGAEMEDKIGIVRLPESKPVNDMDTTGGVDGRVSSEILLKPDGSLENGRAEITDRVTGAVAPVLVFDQRKRKNAPHVDSRASDVRKVTKVNPAKRKQRKAQRSDDAAPFQAPHPTMAAVIGGERIETDITVMEERKVRAKIFRQQRVLAVFLRFEKQLQSMEEPLTFQEAAEELIELSKEEFAKQKRRDDQVFFNATVEILICIWPDWHNASLYLNSQRVYAMTRLLQDNPTETKIIAVLNGWQSAKVSARDDAEPNKALKAPVQKESKK